MDGATYGRLLRKLLPPGPLWNQLAEGNIAKFFHGCGDELARLEARGKVLIEETDPRTATETLPDWEQMVGLPDEDVPEIAATDAERRLAVVQKMIRSGGQTPAYFVTLAAACGWTVYVEEGYAATVWRCNMACNLPLRNDAWAHVWEVQFDSVASVFLPVEQVQAILRRAAPAHTEILFVEL